MFHTELTDFAKKCQNEVLQALILLQAEKCSESYAEDKDKDLVRESDGTKDVPLAAYFTAGQSRRIWNELYKVSAIKVFKLQYSH